MHLGGDNGAGEDTATDADHTSEGAFLVDIGALNGGLGRTEAQTNILVPSPVASVLARSTDLVVQEDVRLNARISIANDLRRNGCGWQYLLLESALRLDSVFQLACIMQSTHLRRT